MHRAHYYIDDMKHQQSVHHIFLGLIYTDIVCVNAEWFPTLCSVKSEKYIVFILLNNVFVSEDHSNVQVFCSIMLPCKVRTPVCFSYPLQFCAVFFSLRFPCVHFFRNMQSMLKPEGENMTHTGQNCVWCWQKKTQSRHWDVSVKQKGL